MDLTESFIDLTILNDYGMRQKDWGGRLTNVFSV